MQKLRILTALALISGFMCPGLSHAESAGAAAAPAVQTAGPIKSNSASAVVRNFYVQLADTMKQGDSLGFSGRVKKLTPAIQNAYNMPLMTKFAVGLNWNSATPDEQKQLISAFSDFSVATYASRFTKYDGEQFKIVDEKPASDGTIVETTLQPKDGDTVSLSYLMKQDDKGSWRIVDVFLNGTISELATRRSEFGSIVQHDGINALVNSLGDKAKQMGPS
jgi:phospholipid transport system substrate-binding protein